MIGGPHCKVPYSASLLNVSAMSYGALSKNAILALNTAAKMGNFYHNTVRKHWSSADVDRERVASVGFIRNQGETLFGILELDILDAEPKMANSQMNGSEKMPFYLKFE